MVQPSIASTFLKNVAMLRDQATVCSLRLGAESWATCGHDWRRRKMRVVIVPTVLYSPISPNINSGKRRGP